MRNKLMLSIVFSFAFFVSIFTLNKEKTEIYAEQTGYKIGDTFDLYNRTWVFAYLSEDGSSGVALAPSFEKLGKEVFMDNKQYIGLKWNDRPFVDDAGKEWPTMMHATILGNYMNTKFLPEFIENFKQEPVDEKAKKIWRMNQRLLNTSTDFYENDYIFIPPADETSWPQHPTWVDYPKLDNEVIGKLAGFESAQEFYATTLTSSTPIIDGTGWYMINGTNECRGISQSQSAYLSTYVALYLNLEDCFADHEDIYIRENQSPSIISTITLSNAGASGFTSSLDEESKAYFELVDEDPSDLKISVKMKPGLTAVDAKTPRVLKPVVTINNGDGDFSLTLTVTVLPDYPKTISFENVKEPIRSDDTASQPVIGTLSSALDDSAIATYSIIQNPDDISSKLSADPKTGEIKILGSLIPGTYHFKAQAVFSDKDAGKPTYTSKPVSVDGSFVVYNAIPEIETISLVKNAGFQYKTNATTANHKLTEITAAYGEDAQLPGTITNIELTDTSTLDNGSFTIKKVDDTFELWVGSSDLIVKDYQIQVKATDSNNKTKTETLSFSVGKGAQTLVWDMSKDTIEYGTPLTLKALGGESETGEIIYGIKAGNAFAEIKNGKLVPLKGGGTVTITANKAGNNNYEAAIEIEKDITITKKDIVLKPKDIRKYVGQKLQGNGMEEVIQDGVSALYGSDTLENSFDETNALYAYDGSFNDESGPTSSPVNVLLSGVRSDKYNIASYAKGSLTVVQDTLNDNYYTIDKTMVNGWYNQDVSITPAGLDDYTLIRNGSQAFKDRIVLDTTGTYDVKLQLKNSGTAKKDAITSTKDITIKLDKDKPLESKISASLNNDKKLVIQSDGCEPIQASGVKSIQYQLLPDGGTPGSVKTYDENNLEDLSMGFAGSVKIIVTDNAGNISEVTRSNLEVKENIKPLFGSVSAQPTQWTKGMHSFHVEASDVGSGIKTIKVKASNGGILIDDQNAQVDEITKNYEDTPLTTTFDFRIWSNGTYTLQVVDAAGNSCLVNKVISVEDKMDNDLPTFKTFTVTNHKLTLIGEDASSGVDTSSIKYSLEPKDVNDETKEPSDPTFDLTYTKAVDLELSFDGWVCARVNDNAGNTSENVCKRVSGDSKAPIVDVDHVSGLPASGTWTNDVVTLSIPISDGSDGTGIKKIEVTTKDGSIVTNVNSGEEGKSYTKDLSGQKDYSLSLKVHASGSYTIKVSDLAGNTKSYKVDVSGIDIEAPDVNVHTDIDTGYDEATITLEGVDYPEGEHAGIKHIKYQFIESGSEIDENAWINYTSSFTKSNVMKFTGQLCVYVEDNAGNDNGPQYKCVKLSPDNEGPQVSVSDHQLDESKGITWTNAADIEVTLTLEDKGSGIAKMKILDSDDQQIGEVYQYQDNTFKKVQKITIRKNGTYKVEMEDAVGNRSSSTFIVDRFDRKPPVVNDVVDSVKKFLFLFETNTKEIDIIAEDEDSGVASYLVKYVYEGDTFVDDPDTASTWQTFDQGDTIEIDRGFKGTIYVYAYDQAGNRSTKVFSKYLNPDSDTMNPQITINNHQSDWTNQNIQVEVSASDDLAGMKQMELKVNDKVIDTLTSSVKPGKLDPLTKTYEISENGTYTVIAIDKANNEETKSFTIDKIDKAPPTIQANKSDDGEHVIYTLIANDDLSKIDTLRYRYIEADGSQGNWITYDEDHKPKKPMNDTGHLEVEAKDKAGNIKVETYDYLYDVIDETAPLIGEILVHNDTWTNQPVMIDIPVSDTQSGIKGIMVSGDGILSGGNYQSEGIIKSYTHRVSVNKNGIYQVIAVDNDDNTSSIKEFTIDHIDMVKPILKDIKDNDEFEALKKTLTLQEDHIDHVLVNGEMITLKDHTFEIVRDKAKERSEFHIELLDLAGNKTSYHIVLKGKKIDQDTDDDGKPDYNQDSDEDGFPDVDVDLDGNGSVDINIDLDHDGVPDINIDTTGDGKPDYNVTKQGERKAYLNIGPIPKPWVPDVCFDIDDDGEKDYCTMSSLEPVMNIDTNHDLYPDINLDINDDNLPELNIAPVGSKIAKTNIDSDGDGIAEVNIDENKDGEVDEGTPLILTSWKADFIVSLENGFTYGTMKGLKNPESGIQEIEDEETKSKVESEDTIFDKETKFKVEIITKQLGEEVIKTLNSKVEHQMSDMKIQEVFDVKLLLHEEEIQPQGMVIVSIYRNETLKKLKNPKVIHIDDENEIEVMESWVEGDYIKFKTPHFSRFAIIDEQEIITPDPTPTPDPNPSKDPNDTSSGTKDPSDTSTSVKGVDTIKKTYGAQTGDTTSYMTYIMIMMVSLVAMVIVKKKHRED